MKIIDEVALARDSKTLKLYLVPGSGAPGPQSKIYDLSFKAWKETWFEAFQELDGAERIYSNDFTRQDYTSALFDGETCLAMTLNRVVDLSKEESRDDSYFEVWPESAKDELMRDSPLVLICSYFTVCKAARNNVRGYSMKDLMMALNVTYLLNSEASVFAGTTRNNKDVNGVCERAGAKPIYRNLKMHGVLVDLMAFYKRDLQTFDTPFIRAAKQLWSQKFVVQAQTEIRKVA